MSNILDEPVFHEGYGGYLNQYGFPLTFRDLGYTEQTLPPPEVLAKVENDKRRSKERYELKHRTEHLKNIMSNRIDELMLR
jgi:hypothetical protein